MAYSVFRVPNGITVLPTDVAQVVTTVQGASGQTADLQRWQNYLGAVLAEVDSVGNISGVGATFSGSAAINGGSITTSAATANLFNSATTLNLGTASTNVNVGSVGTTNVNNIIATGTLGVTGVATFNNTINANGGTIATSATSATLFATPTTVNAFAAATGLNVATSAANSTITIGSSTSTTTIAGNLIVNGTTTTVNALTLNIDDPNINIGSDIPGASGTLLDGGGITLGSGASVKTLNYVNGSTAWTSSENFNLAVGKVYRINSTEVLSSTTLGSAVVSSSLTSVGTLTGGTWNANVIGTGYTQAKVTAVTAGATNTIAVTGATHAPFINLVAVGAAITNSLVKITTDAYGRVSANTAVASGDIPNLSAAQITAGTLAVAQGGTNLGSYGTGVLLQASGTTISQLSPTTSGLFLRTNGANTFSTYSALTSSDVTTALGFTPANSSSGITGSGAAGRLTIWNTAGEVTSDIDLVYSTSSNTLSIAHGNITASSNPITIGTTGSDEIDNFTKTSYRTAKYLIQVANSISGPAEFQVSEVLVVHDGTTAYLTEYGKMYTGANPLLTSITVSIVGGTNVSLKAAAAAAGAIVRFTKITMNN
jgi:hypothetical protein